ncbi:MAG TPA: PfkB family carbohydrate kinase, partial [Longimicrobium sp.]|nr:PfkB family carbohydrate kinase [Longimicrobium sp.]
VVVSRAAEGALFITRGAVVNAEPPELRQVGSTAGAGDAMVAGIVAARILEHDLANTARLATAFSAAVLDRREPGSPSREAIEALARAVAL